MMDAARHILVLNCGSSSIKWALFALAPDGVPRQPRWQGQQPGIGGRGSGARRAAIRRVLAAVAHRVVHGGSRFCAPVQVDAAVLEELRALVPLAPLQQPFALDAMAAALAHWPAVPQMACFDTAFHRTLPRVEQLLPLPYRAWEQGVRRYGFHGLSYEYLSIILPERHGARAQGRVIAAHLGSGASLCAMQGGRSVATTMGFSALDGLMMGTRCGALDPGVLLYLMEQEHMTRKRLAALLYHESGLLGVSGLSAEPGQLLEMEKVGGANGKRAQDALGLYVRRIVREIGAMTAVLGGLDLLAFTGGVGEHCAEVRRRVCAGLGFLGLTLDEAANLAAAPVISAASSPVLACVEPANEEWICARQAMQLAPPAPTGRTSAASPRQLT